MFWDRAAGVYDLFANVWNKKTHGALCAYVEAQISPADEVLECACGTGLLTEGIAAKCKRRVHLSVTAKTDASVLHRIRIPDWSLPLHRWSFPVAGHSALRSDQDLSVQTHPDIHNWSAHMS